MAHILLLCVGCPCAILATGLALAYVITRADRRAQPGPPGASPWPQVDLDTIEAATRCHATGDSSQ